MMISSRSRYFALFISYHACQYKKSTQKLYRRTMKDAAAALVQKTKTVIELRPEYYEWLLSISC